MLPLLAVLIFARSPVVAPAATPTPEYVADRLDARFRGLILMADAAFPQAGACAALSILREVEVGDRGESDFAGKRFAMEESCRQECQDLLAGADASAAGLDYADAHATARRIQTGCDHDIRLETRLRMSSWQPAPGSERPGSYAVLLAQAREAVRAGRFLEARTALEHATLVWPAGADARSELALVEKRMQERAKTLLAEARASLTTEPSRARTAITEALRMVTVPGTPLRGEVLALAVDVYLADERWGTPEKKKAFLAWSRAEGQRRATAEDWAGARDVFREALKAAPGDPTITGELDTVSFRCAAEAKARLDAAKKRLEAKADRAIVATDLREAIRFASGPADPIAVEAQTLLDGLARMPR